MTIDEAIIHCEEVAEQCEFDTDWGMGNHFIDRSEVADVIKCGKEHRQLAEWLKELKAYKEQTDGDLTSRDFMKKLGATCIAKRSETGELVAILSIDNLPSAENTAEWIDNKDVIEITQEIQHHYMCSKCGMYFDRMTKYCPNCGHRMKGVEE